MTDTIEIATSRDEDAAIAAIVLAFGGDPAARWTWPDPHTFLTNFPRFARKFGGAAFTHGAAYRVTGTNAGTALWLPPGIEPDEEALGAIIEESTPQHLRADVEALLEQMGAYHPSEPHWYLPLIGVDPAKQGRGYGSALLRPVLDLCDRDGSLAYLESSNPRNIPLYRRHGFDVIGSIQSGTSPTIVPMLRKPR
jgi:ribosomal protein S18 acetylase RimI-like enzyme